MEKLNIAEILKDCPKGMELDCTIFNGKVCFEGIDTNNPKCPIRISINLVNLERLDAYGQYSTRDYAKCVIFPKGKTTWEGFQKPFKEGDVVFYDDNIAIFKEWGDRTLFRTYVKLYIHRESIDVDFPLFGKYIRKEARLATKEEKQKLFDAIKANGYKWNAETKTLEKLKVQKLVNMKKNYTVKDLITYLLDFNMEAEVLVNASGVPEGFDISWSDGKDSSDPSIINSKKRADTVCFNVICGEK